MTRKQPNIYSYSIYLIYIYIYDKIRLYDVPQSAREAMHVYEIYRKMTDYMYENVINTVCCVGRVEIQIEKGRCTADTDSIV